MKEIDVVKGITQEVTPALERVLATDSLTSAIPESLQLSYSQCGLATAALQSILLEKYDIKTDRVINKLTEAPRGLNFRIGSHVVLHGDEYVIDPTYRQFMDYVGLTHKTAVDYDIEGLYPPHKIMVYSDQNATAFADKFAAHAHKLDEDHAIPQPVVEYAPTGALRGSDFATKQAVYRSIWTRDNYQPFPIEEQNEHMQHAAGRVAASVLSIIG